MPDWNTRLAVYLNDEDDPVTPIDSFSPSFSLSAEPLHSIEQTHIGVIYTPQAITFMMTVRAIGDAVAKLTSIAFKGERFTVALQLLSDQNDWAFDSIVLSDCIITSAAPSPATIAGAPAATFSGICLGAGVTPAGGKAESIP